MSDEAVTDTGGVQIRIPLPKAITSVTLEFSEEGPVLCMNVTELGAHKAARYMLGHIALAERYCRGVTSAAESELQDEILKRFT